MLVIEDIEKCRNVVREVRRTGATVGLVPTMGSLHKGHESLIEAARKRCGFVAVTIFVNPKQFDSATDLQAYPRPREADIAVCESSGADLVFTPSASAIYPGGEVTSVHVSGVSEGLCGRHRAGHFDSVALVVTKLFNIVPADLAFFGEKDFQQMVVIRHVVRDLNLPIEVVACPTVRETDGLAYSSRNAYLSKAERKQAGSLSRALFAAVKRIEGGERDARAITSTIREEILAAGPVEVEYVDVVDAKTLEVLDRVDRAARICLAVKIRSCRLIDNVGVEIERNDK